MFKFALPKYMELWSILSKRERIKYLSFVVIQITISLLDLISVLLLAIVSLLVFQENKAIISSYTFLQAIFNQDNIVILSCIAGILLLLKTFLSFYITKKILNFSVALQVRLTSELLQKSTLLEYLKFQKIFTSELPGALTEGISSISVGFFGYSLLACSETALLVFLCLPLGIFAPWLTFGVIIIFAIAFKIINFFTNEWAKNSGYERLNFFESMRIIIHDASNVGKVLKVSGKFDHTTISVSRILKKGAEANAKTYLIQQVPKYVLETTLVAAASLLALFFALSGNIAESIGVLVLFITSTMRILPSLLRLQGALLIMKSSLSEGKTFLSNYKLVSESRLSLQQDFDNRNGTNPPQISIKNLSFSYPNSEKLTFENFSSEISAGEIVVIKGRSGVGKSTLADIILGLRSPTMGTIKIDNQTHCKLVSSYMPQETALIHGSVAENVALGVLPSDINFELVSSLISEVDLESWLVSLQNGINTDLSKLDSKMSGGQKQRLGLARSLYSTPDLLIVDEPTSALDSDSEEKILSVLSSLRGKTTIILIAHSQKPEKIADSIIRL